MLNAQIQLVLTSVNVKKAIQGMVHIAQVSTWVMGVMKGIMVSGNLKKESW